MNNFGFGGSDAHAIIDDTCGYIRSQGLIGRYQRPTTQSESTHGMENGGVTSERENESRIFPLSSFHELSERIKLNNLSQYRKNIKMVVICQDKPIGDLAYALSERRSKLLWKAAFAADSLSQLAKAFGNRDFEFRRVHLQHLSFNGRSRQIPSLPI